MFAPKGGVGQDDARVQPRGRGRPGGAAHGPDRRQPPVRRHARAAQGADRGARRCSTCRPTGSRSRTSRTCCGATRRASTSCSRRRGSRWPRWSRSATSRRRCRCCAASTRSSIVDTPAVVNDINLAFLDASDTILEVVTYDSTTIHSTMVMADAFRMIGYPPTKVRYLVNRADSTGGIDPAVLSQALGRVPGAPRELRRRARRPGEQRGHPVRARRPERADQPGRRAHGGRAAGRAACRPRRGGGSGGGVSDPRPDRRLRLGRRRPDRPARDPAPHPPRIHDLPRRQRARPVRRPLRRGGAPVLDGGARRARRRATSRRSSSPATRPRPSRCATCGPATTCRCWASSARARPPRRSRPATGGWA